MINIYDLIKKGYKHKNLIFWAGLIESIPEKITDQDVVIDYGCGSGLFLRLLHENYPYKIGYGIDTDESALKLANELNNKTPIVFCKPSDICISTRAKYIFSQEVLWMIEDINIFIDFIEKHLDNNGFCLFTIGCHTRNPLWTTRKKELRKNGIIFHDHDINNMAKLFFERGFFVGIKRLPINGFIVYHPDVTEGKIYELVKTTYEEKLLFMITKEKTQLSSTLY